MAMITCRYCNMEISMSAVEAEDGYCPECGSVITPSSLFQEDADDIDEIESDEIDEQVEEEEIEDIDFDEDFEDFDEDFEEGEGKGK